MNIKLVMMKIKIEIMLVMIDGQWKIYLNMKMNKKINGL